MTVFSCIIDNQLLLCYLIGTTSFLKDLGPTLANVFNHQLLLYIYYSTQTHIDVGGLVVFMCMLQQSILNINEYICELYATLK